jgi:hypothetical protein
MRILNRSIGQTGRLGPRRREERGVAVIVVLALLALIFLYIAANARTLDHLNRELKLIEKQQIRRLAGPTARTNSVAVHVEPPAAPKSSPD